MSKLKLWAHRHLPYPAKRALAAVMAQSFYRPDPRVNAFRQKYLQLNQGCDRKQIRMRSDVSFLAEEESIEAFQWFCWRSPQMVAEYDLFLEVSRNCRWFLDVGASHGVYSLSFCALDSEKKALAVDPSPLAQHFLNRNIALNHFEARLQTEVCAAGEGSTIFRARRNWHHVEATLEDDAEVFEAQPIDAICTRHRLVPDLVKIDVEGFELHAVRGAREVLGRGPCLFIEIHPDLTFKLGYDHVCVFDELSAMGYEIEDVMSGRLDRRAFGSKHHTFFSICRPIARASSWFPKFSAPVT